MSEIPESPTNAARVLIGWFAGALAFQAVHVFDEAHYGQSIAYIVGAIVVAFGDYNLKTLLAGSPRLTKSLNDIASDARWWIGAAMLTLLVISVLPYIEQRRFPYAYWFGVGRAPPTIPAEFPPTSLRLQFNAVGARPYEIESKNIKWALTSVEEFLSLKEGTTCPPSVTIFNQPSLICTPVPPTAVIARNWFLFLSFQTPIVAKKIDLDAHGAKLPKWDQIELTDRQAVLRFRDNLPTMILDISPSEN